MEKDATQFDSMLGGTQDVPQAMNIYKCITYRSIEISAMTENLLKPSSTKLIFQTLPNHMRRRVMSHNSKRLPRKLRESHLSQLKKNGMPLKPKRPSRKYRRRPKNLLLEYHRRQRRHAWLETHIWSAKRFHMTDRWGYRLPESPCDKSFRACYRASSAHSLLQDISYYGCIEIKGELDKLKEGFLTITSSACGLGVFAKAYLSGSREGSADIFHPNQYPFGYIGKIDFLWKYNDSSLQHTIWIFVHPAFYSTILSCLIKIFNLTKMEKHKELANDEVPVKKMKIEVADVKCKPLTEYSNTVGLKLTELTGSFNRFRLTGPKSHAILVKALRAIDVVGDAMKNKWIGNWFNRDKDKTFINSSFKYWNDLSNISSPAELPSRMVLGLNVKDPRLCRPLKRTKAEIDKDVQTKLSILLNIPEQVSRSPLWFPNLRAAVVKDKLSTSDLNKYVAEHQYIPADADVDNPNVQPVPIIIIQRPGHQTPSDTRLGFASGWDMIMPQGYAMPFWLSLILWGARAGGLRESERLSFEAGQCYFPPNSEAAKAEEDRTYEKTRARYYSLPPNKRVNYLKISINSPFLCRWDLLNKDWKLTDDNKELDYEVLRDKLILTKLHTALKTGKLELDIPTCKDAIVPITVTSVGRGNLSNFAIICRPKQNDLCGKAPVEPAKRDKNAVKRKELRKTHQTLLKKLRRQRLRKRKATKPCKLIKKTASGTPKKVESSEINEYRNKMQELWLPTDIENVRWQCSREVMGLVTHGGFSYSRACGFGVGYVAYNSLIQLIQGNNVKNNSNRVLVRNTTSRQYRVAVVEVIL